MKVVIKLDAKSSKKYEELASFSKEKHLKIALDADEYSRSGPFKGDTSHPAANKDGALPLVRFSGSVKLPYGVYTASSAFTRRGDNIFIHASRNAFREWLPELAEGLATGALKGRVVSCVSNGPSDMKVWETRPEYMVRKYLIDATAMAHLEARIRAESGSWEPVSDTTLTKAVKQFVKLGAYCPEAPESAKKILAGTSKADKIKAWDSMPIIPHPPSHLKGHMAMVYWGLVPDQMLIELAEIFATWCGSPADEMKVETLTGLTITRDDHALNRGDSPTVIIGDMPVFYGTTAQLEPGQVMKEMAKKSTAVMN